MMTETVTEPQVKPTAPNWELAKALFLRGHPTHVITQQIGVTPEALRQRVKRGGWSQIRTQTLTTVSIESQTVKLETAEAAAVTEKGETVRSDCVSELARCASKLKTLPAPKTASQIEARAKLVSTISMPGKTLLGWSDGASVSAIRISVLNAQRPLTDNPKAIDVPSTQVVDDAPIRS